MPNIYCQKNRTKIMLMQELFLLKNYYSTKYSPIKDRLLDVKSCKLCIFTQICNIPSIVTIITILCNNNGSSKRRPNLTKTSITDKTLFHLLCFISKILTMFNIFRDGEDHHLLVILKIKIRSSKNVILKIKIRSLK